jgi:hypothetical protein
VELGAGTDKEVSATELGAFRVGGFNASSESQRGMGRGGASGWRVRRSAHSVRVNGVREGTGTLGCAEDLAVLWRTGILKFCDWELCSSYRVL